MLKKWSWLVWLMTRMVVDAGAPETSRDAPLGRLLSKHSSARAQWTYEPKEDFYRHQPQAVSHGYGSQAYESTLRTTDTSSEYPGYSTSSQDYWRFGSANSNFTGTSNHGYSATHLGSTGGTSYQDFKLGSHSLYQYHQMRPAAASHVAVKKVPAHYFKGSLHLLGSDAAGKSKYKKTILQQTAASHKKNTYPRVHKPYAKLKYPARKTVPYRNYYRSPYQQYPSSGETFRYKLRLPGEDYYKASTTSPSPASITQRYHTTERMDDAYPEGSSASEDYSGYNETHRGGDGYYESYEEVEKTTSEPEESLYDETTTRGYYGDRIYMSTQLPLLTSPDRAAVKNKYFIVRRTSNDEDIETIFE